MYKRQDLLRPIHSAQGWATMKNSKYKFLLTEIHFFFRGLKNHARAELHRSRMFFDLRFVVQHLGDVYKRQDRALGAFEYPSSGVLSPYKLTVALAENGSGLECCSASG